MKTFAEAAKQPNINAFASTVTHLLNDAFVILFITNSACPDEDIKKWLIEAAEHMISAKNILQSIIDSK